MDRVQYIPGLQKGCWTRTTISGAVSGGGGRGEDGRPSGSSGGRRSLSLSLSLCDLTVVGDDRGDSSSRQEDSSSKQEDNSSSEESQDSSSKGKGGSNDAATGGSRRGDWWKWWKHAGWGGGEAGQADSEKGGHVPCHVPCAHVVAPTVHGEELNSQKSSI